MDNLATALSTVPFFERNDIKHSVFSQTDLQTMNSRSIRYKQKYYNDKSYTTPELDAKEKILKSMLENNDSKCEQEDESKNKKTVSGSESKDIVFEDSSRMQTKTECSEKILEVDSLGRVKDHDSSRPDAKHNKTIHKIKMQNVDVPVGKLDNKALDEDGLDELILGHVDGTVDIAAKNVEVDIKNIVDVENQLLQGKCHLKICQLMIYLINHIGRED